MLVNKEAHLTYCTNIHPGETWEEIFESLKTYCLNIKTKISPTEDFGIGLRLSQKSARALLADNNLSEFKNWLDTNNLYVFTMNGFPYGDFHNTVVKDQVHKPDWTTQERLDYTKDLMYILAHLLPEGMEGGVSTSPLSYKYWFESEEEKNKATEKACDALIDVVLQLVEIKIKTGKLLHLDIEPEPDGLLENTQEVLDFYKKHLFTNGIAKLSDELKCSSFKAKEHILNHIQLCYDVCHFALVYESPEFVISSMKDAEIKIGKIQISAAIKCKRSEIVSIEKQQSCLRQFDEPTYLHQSVVKLKDNRFDHFSDLKEGINLMSDDNFKELRTHFHVPIFVDNFQVLESTQDDIIKALDLWKKTKYSKHLEVETYTWSVLPEHLQKDLTNSITRELSWVIDHLSN